MAVTQITDHADQAEARLPEQFKNKANMVAVIRAIGLEMQDLEDAIFPMFDLLDIATMIGAQLDGIGDILTETRQGLSDVDYRVALLDKAARITASGTAEQVIERFIALTSPASPVIWQPGFPAGYYLFGDGAKPDGLIEAIVGATGVGIFVGLLDLFALESSAPYELSGSTYDGDDLELTGSTYDGNSFDATFGAVDDLFLLEDDDTMYVVYESSSG